MKQFYAYLQALSLDVVAGSLINTLLIGRYLGVEIPFVILFALGSATWLTYTIDHLADAQKLKEKAGSFRHLFHFKNKNILIVLGIILLITNAVNLFYLPPIILKAGIYLLLGVGIYFFFLKLASGQPSLFKELTIALIYVMGIFLAPLSLSLTICKTDVYLLVIQYFMLALINLLIFSLFDIGLDEKEQHSSLIRKLGEKCSKFIIKALIMSLFIVQIAYFVFQFQTFALLNLFTLSMNVAFATIMLFPAYFIKEERYRILGDMAFIFPIFLLF
jgi:hypothetical protein